MSEFSGLFIGGILWGTLWHFSQYLIEVTIKNVAWADVAGKTTGVVVTYPFVEAFIVKAVRMLGIDGETIKKLRVCIFFGYFGAYLPAGIGKVIGTALDGEVKK